MDDTGDDQTVEPLPSNNAVDVTAQRLSPAPYRGLSPLQAGLLYGGGVSTVAGPGIGALVGLGVGLYTKLHKDNVLDHQARQINDVVNETIGLKNQAMTMMQGADPDTQKFLMEQMRLSSEGLTQFVNEGDPAGRAKMDNANLALASVLSANMAQRRDTANATAAAQRQLVASSAETYRNQFQTNQDNFRTVNTQADKILDLTNATDFDPNKAVNKGLIVGMLTTGIGMYRDNPADYTDAISQGVSGLGQLPGKAGVAGNVLSALVGGTMTYLKSKEFQLSKDDYIRLAMNMKSYATKDAQIKSAQLSQQAQNLDSQARAWGVFDDKTDLHGYITGGVDKLPITAPPTLPPAPTASQLLPSAGGTQPQVRTGGVVGGIKGGALKWLTDQTTKQNTQSLGLSESRPVN